MVLRYIIDHIRSTQLPEVSGEVLTNRNGYIDEQIRLKSLAQLITSDYLTVI